MTPSGIQRATFRPAAQCLKQLHPSLSENNTDSESVYCKENLSQQSNFYIERQMYWMTLHIFFIKHLKKFEIEFERNIFSLCFCGNYIINTGDVSLNKYTSLILIDRTDFNLVYQEIIA
jgi:hypothetical protein